MDKDRFSRPRALGVLALLVIVLAGLAWANRFTQDDAFISYRYAQNLVDGHGLVWNAQTAQKVEGYTNFLWTVLMAVPLKFGWNVISFASAAGLVCFIISLACTYVLGARVLASRKLGLIAVALVGANFTFSAYATGGLETQLQTCLLLAATCLSLRIASGTPCNLGSLVAFSLLCAAAMLTRMDSALIILVLGLAALRGLWKSSAGQKPLALTLFILPGAAIVAAWLVWKCWYYGGILPNTFYVKAAGSSLNSLLRGGYYILSFLLSYMLVPFVLIALFAAKRLFLQRIAPIGVLLVATSIWLLYVLKVGGDFMEFRFIVPVWPLLVVLILWLVIQAVGSPDLRAALIALVFVGSVHHALTLGRAPSAKGFETIPQLQGHLFNESENWIGVGKLLGKQFAGKDVTIATTAAGAIPFYSTLTTIDMLGLSDTWIARHGEAFKERAGHQRVASLKYLVDQKVNLVVGHPWLKSTADPSPSAYPLSQMEPFRVPIHSAAEIPAEAKIVEIPLNDRYRLVLLYLVPSTAVDEAIVRNGWRTVPIARS